MDDGNSVSIADKKDIDYERIKMQLRTIGKSVQEDVRKVEADLKKAKEQLTRMQDYKSMLLNGVPIGGVDPITKQKRCVWKLDRVLKKEQKLLVHVCEFLKDIERLEKKKPLYPKPLRCCGCVLRLERVFPPFFHFLGY